MSAMAIRERTAMIASRFQAERDTIANGSQTVASLEQIDQLESLASGTIYLLRDNNAACVRAETHSAELGMVDLGYAEAKAEIDSMITAIIDWKFGLRAARQDWVDQRDQQTQAARSEEYLHLVTMYRSGVLSSEQFEARRSRLQQAEDAAILY